MKKLFFILLLLSMIIVLSGTRASGYAVFGPVPVNTMNQFNLSGVIRDYNNVAIDGVTISATGLSGTQTLTNGTYQITVPRGWSGTITASKPGWVFSPNGKTYNNVTSNLVNNNYSGRLAQPVFTPPGNSYTTTQYVALQSPATGNVKFRYSIFSTPSYYSGSIYYNELPIVIQNNTTIKAVAYIEGRPGTVSVVAEAYYEIAPTQLNLLTFEVIDADVNDNQIYYVSLISDDGFIRLPVDTNNNVAFSKTLLGNCALGFSEIKRFEIQKSTGELIGHIEFKYTIEDFNDNFKVRGTLIVHGQHTPNNNPGGENWEYYEPGEHMVSMLIKPEAIHADREPLLLVHGVGGSYPYFGDLFIKQLNGNPNTTIDDTNDIWEFYYPYDQQIELSATLLGNAVATVRANNYQPYPGRLNIIAHSMGGLVTRKYIQQCQDNDTGIGKFVMLGTPNHGSHSSFRISNPLTYPYSSIANDVLIKQDKFSPSIHQMFPGSSFLTNLNASYPRQLHPGAPVQDTYLVVAGTNNPLFWASSEVFSLANDDLVVSIPSASLLNKSIPLATVNENHNSLRGVYMPPNYCIPFNPGFLSVFFSDNYTASNEPFGNSVINFWTSLPITNLLGKSSLVVMQFNAEFNTDLIDVYKVRFRDIYKLRFRDYEGFFDGINPDQINNRLKTCENGTSPVKTYMFMEKQLGTRRCLTDNISSSNYELKLYNREGDWIKTIANALQVFDASTSSLNINLAPGEIALANFTTKNGWLESKRTRDNRNRTLIEEMYYVDSTIDSLIFHICAEGDTIGFANHNAHLLDPQGTIIDPAYASTSPEIEFSEDISAGSAFYYVTNPLTGTWRFRYSDNLQGSSSAMYVDSNINININIQDTLFSIGDQVQINIPQPLPMVYSNPQVSVSVSFTDSNGIVQPLPDLIVVYNPVDSLYEGSFIPDVPGDYTLSVSFQCLVDGSTVYRYVEKTIPIHSYQIPLTVYPTSGEGNLPTTVTLRWNSVSLADTYSLTIFEAGDSLSTVSVSVSDTTYTAPNLELGKEYYWQVSAVNSYGVGLPSDPLNFFTKLPQPLLQTPANNAIDLPQTVNLAWQAVPGAHRYHLQFTDDPLFSNYYINDSLVVSPGLELNGLSNLETYYWRVASVDERGTSDWSETRSFMVRNYMISFPQTVQMRENEALTLYLANYIDDYSPGQFEITVSGAANLTATVSYDRIVITPLENWYGTEDLLLTINDTTRSLHKNNSSSRTVVYQQTISVLVTELNSLPTMTMGENLMLWNSEDKTLNLTPYLADTDNPIGEIQITGIASAHIGISSIGQSITFLPQPGWFGQELIEIRLSNGMPRAIVTARDKKSVGRTENNYTSYYILVNIIDATPVISDWSVTLNELNLFWDTIPGADTYRVFSSDTINGVFTDVTSSGSLTLQNGEMKWQRLTSAARAFYYIKESKGSRTMTSKPILFNK
ncbi:MAG: hypothetical protein PHO32_01805 [Candidatus Cloacimonetes bacterium]|nr:hypothetical protein [Candidatus Cloacimonadota bacterium]